MTYLNSSYSALSVTKYSCLVCKERREGSRWREREGGRGENGRGRERGRSRMGKGKERQKIYGNYNVCQEGVVFDGKGEKGK